MKAWFLCLLLLTLSANAQPAGDEGSVARLNADLMALKSLPALPSGTDLRAADPSPEQCQIMGRFASDLNELYPRGFVTRNFAYVLTSVLAGKNLSDATLTPLTSAILGVSDSAGVCKADSSELVHSVQFRASIEQAYNALIALDVSVPNTQAVVALMYGAANRIAHPIVRPIPPVYRPNR